MLCAIETFDLDKANTFYTYCKQVISNELKDAVQVLTQTVTVKQHALKKYRKWKESGADISTLSRTKRRNIEKVEASLNVDEICSEAPEQQAFVKRRLKQIEEQPEKSIRITKKEHALMVNIQQAILQMMRG